MRTVKIVVVECERTPQPVERSEWFVNAVAHIGRISHLVGIHEKAQIIGIIMGALHQHTRRTGQVTADFANTHFGGIAVICLLVAVVELAAQGTAARKRKIVFPVAQFKLGGRHIGIIGLAVTRHIGIQQTEITVVAQVLVNHGHIVVGHWVVQHIAACIGLVVDDHGIGRCADGIEKTQSKTRPRAPRNFCGIEETGFHRQNGYRFSLTGLYRQRRLMVDTSNPAAVKHPTLAKQV